MEERKEIIRTVVAQGLRVSKALSIANMARSSYYYRPSFGKKGALPSTCTLYNGVLVSNEEVKQTINEILSDEFIDYGYHRTTASLRQYGYEINHKKVYRLMREESLLLNRIPVKLLNKQYVQYTSPLTTYPFEVIEMDIKYIYLHGERKNAYLITLFDVFARLAPEWEISNTMKAYEVAALIDRLIDNWFIPLGIDPTKTKIRIRTDNGPQFIAQLFIERLKDYQIENEYIKPATPQQNGHIESFHNTINNLVCSKYEFDDLNEAKEIFQRFFYSYNSKRIMKALLYLSPLEFLIQWYSGKIGVTIKEGKIKYYFREKPDEKPSSSSPEVLFMLKNKFNKETKIILTNL